MIAVDIFDEPDEFLIQRCKNDPEVIPYILEKYVYLVKYCARKMYLNGGEFEDLFQEGFLGLYKAILTFDSKKSSFKTFAKLCIERAIITAVKSDNRNKHSVLNSSIRYDAFMDNEHINFEEMLNFRSSPNDDPLHKLVNYESYSFLENQIHENLSKYERKVYDLYIRGMSYKNISGELGTSIKSVDSAITRIRQKVRIVVDSRE